MYVVVVARKSKGAGDVQPFWGTGLPYLDRYTALTWRVLITLLCREIYHWTWEHSLPNPLGDGAQHVQQQHLRGTVADPCTCDSKTLQHIQCYIGSVLHLVALLTHTNMSEENLYKQKFQVDQLPTSKIVLYPTRASVVRWVMGTISHMDCYSTAYFTQTNRRRQAQGESRFVSTLT